MITGENHSKKSKNISMDAAELRYTPESERPLHSVLILLNSPTLRRCGLNAKISRENLQIIAILGEQVWKAKGHEPDRMEVAGVFPGGRQPGSRSGLSP